MINQVYNSPLKAKHLTTVTVADSRTRNSVIEQYNKASSKKAKIGSIGSIKKKITASKGSCGPFVVSECLKKLENKRR